jgi:four helix bundle protein
LELGTKNLCANCVLPAAAALQFLLSVRLSFIKIPAILRRAVLHGCCTDAGMAGKWDLRERTMDFAVDIFRFCRTLPKTDEAREVARQLRHSASSVAANYRAIKRSQSDPVFIAKTAIVIEEADESGFWLELLVEVEIVSRDAARDLLKEANELVAIFTASRKTVVARVAAERARRKGEKKPS